MQISSKEIGLSVSVSTIPRELYNTLLSYKLAKQSSAQLENMRSFLNIKSSGITINGLGTRPPWYNICTGWILMVMMVKRIHAVQIWNKSQLVRSCQISEIQSRIDTPTSKWNITPNRKLWQNASLFFYSSAQRYPATSEAYERTSMWQIMLPLRNIQETRWSLQTDYRESDSNKLELVLPP